MSYKYRLQRVFFMYFSLYFGNRCHSSMHCCLAIFCWCDCQAARARPVFSNALSSLKHGLSHAYRWRRIRKHRRTIVFQGGQAPPPKKNKIKNGVFWCAVIIETGLLPCIQMTTHLKTLENCCSSGGSKPL